jgi:hypothetical protein
MPGEIESPFTRTGDPEQKLRKATRRLADKGIERFESDAP